MAQLPGGLYYQNGLPMCSLNRPSTGAKAVVVAGLLAAVAATATGEPSAGKIEFRVLEDESVLKVDGADVPVCTASDGILPKDLSKTFEVVVSASAIRVNGIKWERLNSGENIALRKRVGSNSLVLFYYQEGSEFSGTLSIVHLNGDKKCQLSKWVHGVRKR